MTKTELIAAIAATTDLPRAKVNEVIEALAAEGVAALRGGDDFTVPGLVKFVVAKKAATKARDGVNPFTQQPMRIPAKPARKVVRAKAAPAFAEAAVQPARKGR